MPAVGPSLSPHLTKRKRSINDAEGPNSPPQKVQARVLGPAPPPPTANPDELDVEDSSDDDGYGPSLQPLAPQRRVLGPTLPARNPDELDVAAESSEDDYGPSSSSAKPNPKTLPSPPPKRVLGPAPPPASLAEKPSDVADSPSSDSDDDDDDYGPSLPPPSGSAAAARLEERAADDEQQRRQASRAAEPAKPQRADWMLAPPSGADWTSRVDPTRLKNRKFASGKGAQSQGPGERAGVSAIWTETPEEKRRRLEDEVLGRKEAATAASTASASSRNGAVGKEDREAEETARRIREYNERNRNRSLVEEHRVGGAQKEEEDDPSKRGFDREKDMALGGRVGHVKQKELLAKAADFGSRFQKGRYL